MTIFAAAIAFGTMAGSLGEQPEVVTPPPIVRVPTPPPPPPAAPRPLPNPSAEARALARAMLDPVAMFETEARRQVLNQLRWPGNGARTCDHANAECARIANEIAAREGAAQAEQMRDAMSRIFGAQFDRTMTAAQIAEASRYLASDSGRALIGSFVSIDERTFAGIESPDRLFVSRRAELAAEFARRTENLPRAPQTTVTTPTVVRRPAPPVPPAPPPAPKPLPRG